MTGGADPMSVLDSTQLILQRAISGATLRGTVLADNLANADTPGFQPSDVDFHAALQGAIDGGPGAIGRVSFSPEQGPPLALRADGNGVDPEAESAKLAENGLELNALVEVAGARVQIMRTAMGVS
ncbi:MAG TPA: flagellar basal body protein [Solirubrobacterales bacterium]|nr:flagellar basal body protein [Solirubrobacterales bacterium]